MRPLTPIEPLPPRPRRRAAPSGPGRRRAALVRTAAGLGAVSLAGPAAYTVQPGDTLSEIARDRGVGVRALAEANGIDDPDHLLAGARLEVPDVEAGGDVDAEALLERVAAEYGWSPAFVKALAWQESGWDQQRTSAAGAIGIMQVMPGTGEFVSRELVGRELDLEDPHDNVRAGVVFLQYLWELTDGDVELTLAGYYQGLRSVGEHGRFESTDRYIANVLALRERF